jgi:hypothetical protein
VGHVACTGEMRNAYNILVRQLEGKRLLRRPRHRQDNIRMDLREIGCIFLVQDRNQLKALVNTVINFWVP